MKKELTSFVKQFVAFVEGDNAEVQAQKAWRSANSALDVQISNMTGDLIQLEDAVEEAAEYLVKARVNGGKQITDRTQYINNLINAKKALTTAEENLADHKLTLDFLKEEKDTLIS